MAPVELYWFGLSPYARSVVVFARAAGVDVVEKIVDLAKGEQNSEEYLKINPMHKVPALKEGDFVLSESIPILQYLASKPGVADHWYPADCQKRAKVNEYLSWHSTGAIPKSNLYFPLVIEHHFRKKPLDEEALKTSAKNFGESLDFIENNFLASSTFLTGSDITIADLYAAVMLCQQEATGFDLGKGRPKVKAWYARVVDQLNPHFDEVSGSCRNFAAPAKREF